MLLICLVPSFLENIRMFCSLPQTGSHGLILKNYFGLDIYMSRTWVVAASDFTCTLVCAPRAFLGATAHLAGFRL